MSHPAPAPPPPAFSDDRREVLAAFLGQPPDPDPNRRVADWEVGRWRKIHDQGRSSFKDPDTTKVFAVLTMIESPKAGNKKKKQQASSGPAILKAQLALMRDKQSVDQTLYVIELARRPDGSEPLIPEICQAIATALGLAQDAPGP